MILQNKWCSKYCAFVGLLTSAVVFIVIASILLPDWISPSQYWNVFYGMNSEVINRTTPNHKPSKKTTTTPSKLTCVPMPQLAREKHGHICQSLLGNQSGSLQTAKDYMLKNPRLTVLPEAFVSLTSDCSVYLRSRQYIMSATNEEEKTFPIAFSIMMFKHPGQVERLLRAIYRPQNVYCIHVDKTSPSEVHQAMKGIANCLENVVMAPRNVDVKWGEYSVLESELICLNELFKHKVKWKYFINLTGQEFPLKTNYELVKILQAYKGSNDIQGTIKHANKDRWLLKKVKPPQDIILTKGQVHIVASRGYIDYILNNKTALDVLEWVKKTKIPDETYFSVMNHNPKLKVPGSYEGEVDDKRELMSRYKIWYSKTKCSGRFSRGICIFGVGDLPALTRVPQLFANKFHYEYETLAYDCLEEWYFNKTVAEKNGKLDFDVSMYKNLSFVRNQVKVR